MSNTVRRALRFEIRGTVQGVGFRPFVYRLARGEGLAGSVSNTESGVEIVVEGAVESLERFQRRLPVELPHAAVLSDLRVEPTRLRGDDEFVIHHSRSATGSPTVRMSPDLPVCDACLRELFDPNDRRYRYPYINCTDCGPRFSIVLELPYDRSTTTMKDWSLCDLCAKEYADPDDRRFHAQPVACPACGPCYRLRGEMAGEETGDAAVRRAAELLRDGAIVAVKGLGGYHLACDAENARAVAALRERKYRKEKPFALMAKDLETARRIVVLGTEGGVLLTSPARPIVLLPARRDLTGVAQGVAPNYADLGVMLPYTPLHHLLFGDGAPDLLVMTSANRSSEPITYEDADAVDRLSEIADALLIGERPIARRVDDSVVSLGGPGLRVVRRARGLAPGVVARLPSPYPVLAVGADLKSAVTLAVDGEAIVSSHLGDLRHHEARQAFEAAALDLLTIYGVDRGDLVVAHDGHPEYASTRFALDLAARTHVAVQHHRAHVAGVLAERGALETRVVGMALDGTGFGDDAAIWGCEIFAGSVAEGFERKGHLRYASLPGGDAAARYPVQAAAGFLAQVDGLPDLEAAPFGFPERFSDGLELVAKGVRSFPTTSAGRLFDALAALLGYTREVTFEGQAAVWLEHRARDVEPTCNYEFPYRDGELDFRPLLRAVTEARHRGTAVPSIARNVHRSLARGLAQAARDLCEREGVRTLVVSGGCFQNALLLRDLNDLLSGEDLEIWTHRRVPAGDGGISLGQAALASAR